MEKYKIAKERYLKGDSLKEICRDLKMNNQLLSNKLKLDGISVRGNRKQKELSELQKEAILRYRSENKSLRWIEKELKINRHKLSLFLKTINENTKNKANHEYYKDIFEVINTEEKAYWLGMLYADGCVIKNKNIVHLTLKNSDEYHLWKFAKFVSPTIGVNIQSKIGKRVVISNEKIYKDVVDKGCIERKSLLLQFPSEEIMPGHLVRHFIRGYFDGDGGLHIETHKNEKTKSIVFYLCGTNEFLDGVQRVLGTNNKYNKSDKINILRIKGNSKPLNILDWLYEDATIYLERKHDIYMQFKSLKEQLPSSGESR